MEEINYLELDDIVEIHDVMIEVYGGDHGIREPGRLDNIIGMPQYEYFGHPKYPKLFDKAAAYLFYLATSHCFIDGNKRTGFTAASVFLEVNSYDLRIDDEQVVEFMVYVSESNQRKAEFEKREYPYKDADELIPEIIDWLKLHSYPL